MGGGAKIPYPKHVWSPAGGWYSQPANWKGNTAVVALGMLAIAGIAFTTSANLERRNRMPEQGRYYPSRYWTKEIREHDAKVAREGGSKE